MPLSPQFPAVSDDPSVDQLIVSEARRISKAYIAQVVQSAHRKILANIDIDFKNYQQQLNAREQFLRKRASRLRKKRRGQLSNPLIQASIDDTSQSSKFPSTNLANTSTTVVNHSSTDTKSLETEADPSLASLRQVCEISFPVAYQIKHLRSIQQLPAYDCWVSAHYDFFVSNENVDVFVPYFGDSKKKRKMAREVYRQMRQDVLNSGADDVSDGEIQGDAFKQPKDDSFYDLSNRRRREAERYTILKVTRRFGDDPEVWKGLLHAFNKADIRCVMLIHKIAILRETQQREAQRKRELREKQSYDIERAITDPYSDDEDVDKSLKKADYCERALKYFCFSCHIFACDLHQGMNAQPVVPIPDKMRDDRLECLAKGVEQPCGSQCFMWTNTRNSPGNIKRNESWTRNELLLLDEAQSLLGDDWCAIATVIGSKSCQQAYERVHRHFVKDRGARLLNVEQVDVDRIFNITSSDSDDGNKPETSACFTDACAFKSTVNKNTKPRFIPCNHSGPCTRRNGCRCALSSIDCESTCGCDSGRFGAIRNGVAWLGRRDSEGRPVICRNRHLGCSCKTACNTESCECFRKQRACDPDFCESCESQYLPEFISIASRRCRNVDLIGGRHKKVFMGRSAVHGFGLFAGQHFRAGELLGPYSGRIMDSELLDKLLRQSQAKKSTYAFNLTHDLTVDAGLVGSKAKFINHADNRDMINCYARVERVRGECRICIKACEPIRPGQELLMDYVIDAEEGNGWLKPDDDDDNSSNDNTSSSDSSDNDVFPARRSKR